MTGIIEGLIKAASFCLASLKAEDAYSSFMNTTIGRLNVQNQSLSSSLKVLARAGDLFATTNYDLLIEKAIEQKPITYNSPARILEILKGAEQQEVIHIHGVYDPLSKIDDIVADDDQYGKIINDEAVQFIQNLISTHPLVIIGCGATVDDPNLNGFLSFATEILGLDISYYYLYCGDTPPGGLSGHMIPVCYGKSYDDLPIAITNMGQYRLKFRFRDENIIRVNPYVHLRSDCSAYSRLHYTSNFMQFVGRDDELLKLHDFLKDNRAVGWWAVIGPGGIGKSRMVLEWLKLLPGNWYGFFANVSDDRGTFRKFEPFSNTVIVIDYVNGHTKASAQIINDLYSVFDESIFKLRILFLERDYVESKDSWLDEVIRYLEPQNRMIFPGHSYQKNGSALLTPLVFSLMSVNDETTYTEYYLRAYFASEIGYSVLDKYEGDLPAVVCRIVGDFRKAFKEEYRRPLFLSMYAEVWICKDGSIGIQTIRELLSVFLETEEKRWLIRFHNDNRLLKSYQKLLALASATDMVCLNDPAGVFQNDADALMQFVKDESRLGGKRTSFLDLFINQEWARNYDEVHELMETGDRVKAQEKIEQIQNDDNKLRRNEKGEPVLLSVLQPMYPDIVRGFIVDWYISEENWVAFTEIAREQTVIEFSMFLSRAITDFPDTNCFKTMALVKPKDEDRFGYYITLLISVKDIETLQSIVDVLMTSCVSVDYGLWESELWRRIAIVLENRANLGMLYKTGLKYYEFVEQRLDVQEIVETVAMTSEAFFVGLHNAERVSELADLAGHLSAIAEMIPHDDVIATACVESYQRLAGHYARANNLGGVRTAWKKMMQFTQRFPRDTDNGRIVSEIAVQIYDWFIEKGLDGRVERTVRDMEIIYNENKTSEIAAVLAVLKANEYFRFKKDGEEVSDSHDKMKSSKDNVFTLYEAYPDVEGVVLAYASLLTDAFMDGANYGTPVSDEDCDVFKNWKDKYPDHRLEMSENYGRVLFARHSYLQSIGKPGEARTVLHEMQSLERDLSRDFEENEVSDMVSFLNGNRSLM